MWVSLVAQTVKRLSAMQRPGFDPWVGKIPWRRKWQPTPVFLPGKSHGPRSLIGYRPWGRKESDTTSLSLSLYLLYRDWLFITVLQTVPTYWLETANINYLLYLQITNLKAVQLGGSDLESLRVKMLTEIASSKALRLAIKKVDSRGCCMNSLILHQLEI